MGCENPISAYVDHDMPNFPNICFLPGSPTLPLNNANFVNWCLWHGGNKRAKSTHSPLQPNFTKKPYAKFYFLARIGEDITNYEIKFWKIIILPGFWHR